MAVRGGNQPLSNFEEELGFPPGFTSRVRINTESEIESRLADALDWTKLRRPMKQNHWPALMLALIAQAEQLLQIEGAEKIDDVFYHNPPETTHAGKVINTLNLTSQKGSVKLRPIYNRALKVIRNDMLRQHPSNPAHATQSWPAYRDWIKTIYQLAPSERAIIANYVWVTGVAAAEEISIAEVRERKPRPFELVLLEMPTAGLPKNIPGGMMLQAITYAYLRADSPNLIMESHSVNTGSSHAGRLGDVDGFRGGEIELTTEVKDSFIESENELDSFVEDIAAAPNATAVVICQGIEPEVKTAVESRNITVLTVEDLARTVSVWDLPKQEEALRGVDYFLARVQRSAAGRQVFRSWCEGRGIGSGLWANEEPSI